MIFRGREKERERHRIFRRVRIRRGDPVWNAGKENLFATVSQDERKEREVVGFQSYTLVIPPFPYMMLAVTMAALAAFLGREEVTPMWRYHEKDE